MFEDLDIEDLLRRLFTSKSKQANKSNNPNQTKINYECKGQHYSLTFKKKRKIYFIWWPEHPFTEIKNSN